MVRSAASTRMEVVGAAVTDVGVAGAGVAGAGVIIAGAGVADVGVAGAGVAGDGVAGVGTARGEQWRTMAEGYMSQLLSCTAPHTSLVWRTYATLRVIVNG